MYQQNLSSVLDRCREAAKSGYGIAAEKEGELQRALNTAEGKVRDTSIELATSKVYSPQVSESLQEQLSEIADSFTAMETAVHWDLERKKSELSRFCITLFGRTEAGKSTLMEVLTKGDGSSIGKGAQRTTRDVRQYEWNSLTITDVPGIGAFEGEEDEQLAFDAAKKADLILFLITDDAPQESEADCFSNVVSLGKPVVCIMNVKAHIAADSPLKLVEYDINTHFDMERLDAIRKQFLAYAERYGQSWSHIPFIYTHLRAAFLAQQEKEPEKAQAYYELSRISFLEKTLVQQVREKGEYLSLKTFIDIISAPLLTAEEDLLNQSAVNSAQGRTLLSKKRQLEAWESAFRRDCTARINSYVRVVRSSLNEEIAAFAEEHFDDDNAALKWQNIIKQKEIEKSCAALLQEIDEQANQKLKEVTRELHNELRFTAQFQLDKNLNMEKLTDYQRIWNWSVIGIEGVLGIAALFVGGAIAGPLGVAAVAIAVIGGLISKLFQDRDEVERKARKALEGRLKTNVNKICKHLETTLTKQVNQLFNDRISGAIYELVKIDSAVFDLADTQRELAWELNEQLLELNHRLLSEAMKLTGTDDFSDGVLLVARNPGNTNLLLLKRGTVVPQEQVKKLSNRTGERIYFVTETENTRWLIAKILNQKDNIDCVRVEESIGVAHLYLDKITPETINRIRLAQQISKTQIINERG